MAHISLDIDGTIAAYPAQFQELASSWMSAGHRVSVLTGSGAPTITQREWEEKANYLNELGMGQSYDDLTVISNQVAGGLATAKAQWLCDNGVDVFIDNNRNNCEAALSVGIDLVLLPYATQV